MTLHDEYREQLPPSFSNGALLQVIVEAGICFSNFFPIFYAS